VPGARTGERPGKHIHRVDIFYIVGSYGLVRCENPDLPADDRDVQLEGDQVAWVNMPPDGKVDNRLENVRATAHRASPIELLR
jgi:hypothetical protein